ncbi:16617_t:CDS:2, partial [Acaulospora colombiana]
IVSAIVRTNSSKPPSLGRTVLECFVSLSPDCKTEDLEDLVYVIMDIYSLRGHHVDGEKIDVQKIVAKFRNLCIELAPLLSGCKRSDKDEHVFLVLDKVVQELPWESLPSLRKRSTSRIPSLSFLIDRLKLATLQQSNQKPLQKPLQSARTPLNPKKVYYVLNPDGDLKRTEDTFTPWLKQMKDVGWNGLIGRKPTEFELSNALSTADLFIYFGHGGAEQYIRGSKIRSLVKCSSVMLWGCSSGAMEEAGRFDRLGTPYNYLLGGCPLIVANLWDVTDRDIDKFAQAVFNKLELKPEKVKRYITNEVAHSVSVVTALGITIKSEWRSQIKAPFSLCHIISGDCEQRTKRSDGSEHAVVRGQRCKALVPSLPIYPRFSEKQHQSLSESFHLDGLRRSMQRFRQGTARSTASTSVADLEPSYRRIRASYESSEASYLTGKQFLNSLVRAKESMQPAIDQIRSLLHPIRRYPNDILSLIFLAAVKAEQDQEHSLISDNTIHSPRYKRRHIALVISQVCKAWRALAHATPELWYTVRLNLSRRSSLDTSKLAHFAYYAKAVPLDVVIYQLQPSFFSNYATMDSDDESEVTPLLDIVNNIGTLEIQLIHFRALPLLSRLGTKKLGRLKELLLRNDHIVLSTNLEFSLTNYLSSMSNLRKLTLIHVSLNLSLHDVGFSLPTLSQLIVHSPENVDTSFAETMDVVEMPYLTSITTNFMALRHSFSTSFSAGRIIAPNLTKFALVSEGKDTSTYLGNFLEEMTTIREMFLYGDFDPLSQPISQSFFKQTPLLHTLTINKMCQQFVDLLSAMDEVQEPLAFPVLLRLAVDWRAHLHWREAAGPFLIWVTRFSLAANKGSDTGQNEAGQAL